MRLRRITAAQTRTAILDAVHALLAAPDAGRLTLDEVARKAGVTRATRCTTSSGRARPC